jgi:hypothetical protein
VIDRAVGMLSERFHLQVTEAFELLRAAAPQPQNSASTRDGDNGVPSADPPRDRRRCRPSRTSLTAATRGSTQCRRSRRLRFL